MPKPKRGALHNGSSVAAVDNVFDRRHKGSDQAIDVLRFKCSRKSSTSALATISETCLRR